MSFENQQQLAQPGYPEEFSFDLNKFERTLLFQKIDELHMRISHYREVDSAEALEILDIMDRLASIGYFYSADEAFNMTNQVLEQRGIDPVAQHKIENDLFQKNMTSFYNLLESIYRAEAIPPSFIEEIRKKAKQHRELHVPNIIQILVALRTFDSHYPRE